MAKKTAWDIVMLARDSQRPKAKDYIENIVDDFIEFHGDRCFGDDKSIIGGIGRINGKAVTIIGQEKGSSTKEKMERNFGMTNPEGYRKALRLMKQAEKFHRPVITFVDTPGAYPGIGAEERGQGEAIARSLMEMSRLKTPIISIVIGEGSSGGALAICVGDKIAMLENSVYSVLSPEGFASILYKDSSKAKEAAEDMKEKLTHITDNEFYVVDSLTHSIPYLVPRASALLDTIGSNFLDSLAAKGLNPNQAIITSVLRKRCETPPPSQRKCFRQLGTLLWSHL